MSEKKHTVLWLEPESNTLVFAVVRSSTYARELILILPIWTPPDTCSSQSSPVDALQRLLAVTDPCLTIIDLVNGFEVPRGVLTVMVALLFVSKIRERNSFLSPSLYREIMLSCSHNLSKH